MNYDLKLFTQLNEEYATKPLVPAARKVTQTAQTEEGLNRVKMLRRLFNLPMGKALMGKRILEIGCGWGNTSKPVSEELGCTVTGVDIRRYAEWDKNSVGDVDLQVLDISTEQYSHLGQFDIIYSFAVWEHMRHPYSALVAAYDLLRPGGVLYLSANLYRGPKASHRYREIFFPWPHLLFADSVFRQYYVSIGKKAATPAWVNKLVAAEYLMYFNLIGFTVEKVWYSISSFDQDFYDRFSDVLERYPRWDLERDFLHAMIRRPL